MSLQALGQQMQGAELSLLGGVIWLLLSLLLGMLGGALMGMALAARDLGYQLAAMMGAFFGPAAVVPATAVALLYVHLR